MRFRKTAGLAAGALAAGAMALPALTTSAAAATSLDLAGDFVCTGQYATYDAEYQFKPGLKVSADGTTVSATSVALTDFKPYQWKPDRATGTREAAAMADTMFAVSKLDMDVVASLNGEDVSLKSSRATALGVNQPQTVADLSGTRTGTAALTKGQIKSVSGAIELQVTFRPGAAPIKAAVPFTCTGTGTPVDNTPSTFECKYNAWALPYSPTITAKGDKGKVEVTMTDFSGIKGVPTFVTVGKVATKATATYGGQAITLAGEVTPATPAPLANGFAVPAMTADRPAGVNGGELTITGLAVTITAMGSENAIACTMAAPVTVPVTPEAIVEPTPTPTPTPTATPTPKPVPVVKGASTAKVTKVTYSKKTKKAKVSVAVTGKKGTTTGKATITIKRGKATIAKKVVSLKAGKASWTSKKIVKKGTYKVTVKYAGSKTYKASKTSKAKSFKIKK